MKYIITIDGLAITGLTFEKSGKANVITGPRSKAIQYEEDEAKEVMLAVGGENLEIEEA